MDCFDDNGALFYKIHQSLFSFQINSQSMKYTAEQVNSMPYLEWMQTIAKELNDAGFLTKGMGGARVPYQVYEQDPRYFFLGSINDSDAMDYLKELGLVNNGRCPMCGAEIKGEPWRFTDGYNSSLNFHICKRCAKEGGAMSVNPANHTGCLVAILLAPWATIKSLISQLSNLL